MLPALLGKTAFGEISVKNMLKEIAKFPLAIKDSESADFIEIKNPATGEAIALVAEASEAIVKKAIAMAQVNFASVMRKMPAHKRSQILERTSELLLERLEEMALTIAQEGGKPLKDARIEVKRAAGTFAIAAQEALNLAGEQIPMDRQVGNEGRLGFVFREPVGVVAAVTPFNFPLNLVAHKVAPAVAAGNTVLLKPSSQTPISSFKLEAIMREAGLPEGALTVLFCRGSKGNALVKDDRINVLTFTGSPEVGWRLRREVASGVRVILELGGNAGVIVHDDADIDLAATACARGGYAHAGQTCISVQRVYVQEKIYDKFVDAFVGKVKSLKVGNPVEESTDVGPLIDQGAADKTIDWIDKAVKAGAKVACGGKVISANYVEPTVLLNTDSSMLVVCEEVFGPVVSVMKYKDLDEAITLMNDFPYGLQAAVFTQSLEVAFKASRLIDAGGVIVNDASTFRADHMPYGGRKLSGLGLEGVKYAIAEMTQPKFICLNLPAL